MTLDSFAVYTCIVGGYDRLRTPQFPIEGARYVCFSESPKHVPEPWEWRPLVHSPEIQDAGRINRYHKLFSHRVLPEFRYSMYVDGNLSLRQDAMPMCEAFVAAGVPIAAFRHFAGRTVESEAEACKACGKISIEEYRIAEEQLAHYRSLGFDTATEVSANYLLLRDSTHDALGRAMEGTWSDLLRFTGRDQLALACNLWQQGLSVAFLQDLGVSHDCIHRRYHRGEFFRDRVMGGLRRRFSVLGASVCRGSVA